MKKFVSSNVLLSIIKNPTFLAHFPLGKKSYCPHFVRPSVCHSFYSSGGGPIWMIYGLIESLWSKDLKCDKKNFWNRSWTWPEGLEVRSSIIHKFFWTFYKCVCEWEIEIVYVCMCVSVRERKRERENVYA